MYGDYRTPANIRAFIRLCVYGVPLIMCPQFATLDEIGFPLFSFVVATFVALLFLLLKSVQRELENPFMGRFGRNDPDDIRLDTMTFDTMFGQSQFYWKTTSSQALMKQKEHRASWST